jgi:hypothetical protein
MKIFEVKKSQFAELLQVFIEYIFICFKSDVLLNLLRL